MLKRTSTWTLGLALGLFSSTVSMTGCSSSDNTAPDGGKKDGGGGDAATVIDAPVSSDGGASDAPIDVASDGAVALTPLQARGSYLVNVVVGCSDCHTPKDAMGAPIAAKFLAGNPAFVALPNGDKLPSRNLTNDPTGLKNRTDDQIKDMILNGKRPLSTGSGTEALNPVMPYYVFHNMTAEDADAIVAYLRTVPAVDSEIPRRAAAFDVPAPAPYVDPNKLPLPLDAYPERESALRGRYLASEVGLCVECHTKHQMTGDPLDSTKFFQGGEDFSSFFASTLMIHPVSANLTSDNATGLGTWSRADVVNALKNGKDKAGNGICPPMPLAAYAHLLDTDATDIANFIKSLPPAVNAVPDMCTFPPGPPADGGADAADAGDAGGN